MRDALGCRLEAQNQAPHALQQSVMEFASDSFPLCQPFGQPRLKLARELPQPNREKKPQESAGRNDAQQHKPNRLDERDTLSHRPRGVIELAHRAIAIESKRLRAQQAEHGRQHQPLDHSAMNRRNHPRFRPSPGEVGRFTFEQHPNGQFF